MPNPISEVLSKFTNRRLEFGSTSAVQTALREPCNQLRTIGLPRVLTKEGEFLTLGDVEKAAFNRFNVWAPKIATGQEVVFGRQLVPGASKFLDDQRLILPGLVDNKAIITAKGEGVQFKSSPTTKLNGELTIPNDIPTAYSYKDGKISASGFDINKDAVKDIQLL